MPTPAKTPTRRLRVQAPSASFSPQKCISKPTSCLIKILKYGTEASAIADPPPFYVFGPRARWWDHRKLQHRAIDRDYSCASRNMECLRVLQGENGALGVDFWKKKIKPAAGRSDLCKQAANAAVTPEDAVIQRSALISAVQVEIWSVYVPYKARTAPWELTFWPMKIKPTACSCDFYQQAAHAALQNREALSSCAVPWCQLCQSKDGADRFRNGRGLRREAIRDGAGFKMRFARNGGCCTRGLVSTALMTSVPVERWGVCMHHKVRKATL